MKLLPREWQLVRVQKDEGKQPAYYLRDQTCWVSCPYHGAAQGMYSVCGTLCALFEVTQAATYSSESPTVDVRTEVRLHCGRGSRWIDAVRVVEEEEVKP